MDDDSNGEWSLSYGVHKGTFDSRDTPMPIECGSLEDCRRKIATIEAGHTGAGFGYVIWYATARGPDGEEVEVHAGNSYN